MAVDLLGLARPQPIDNTAKTLGQTIDYLFSQVQSWGLPMQVSSA